jgi:hypothetical protein
MALDRDGKLYIFELEAWEARPTNLLQVLGYGQIYGPSKYLDLDGWYKKTTKRLTIIEEIPRCES